MCELTPDSSRGSKSPCSNVRFAGESPLPHVLFCLPLSNESPPLPRTEFAVRPLISLPICILALLALCFFPPILRGEEEEAPGIVALSDPEIEETEEQQPGESYFAEELLPPAETVPEFTEMPEPPGVAVPEFPGSKSPGIEIEIESIPLETEEEAEFDMFLLNSSRYEAYRSGETMHSYLPGNGENFGWIDLQSSPYIKREMQHGITTAINLHLLAGPDSTPIPPRLWDFIIGYQHRGELSESFSYDLAGNVGVFSDFEDSASDGIRFPSHAVGMVHFNCDTDFVFGVDYLDRDDLALLPVVGFAFHPQDQPRWRLDLVFPRPRLDVVLNCRRRMYLAAFLDGGSWDIERPDESNDVMTYRDYRAVLGFEYADKIGGLSAIEAGYVFDRELLFREDRTVTGFDDAFLIRMAWRH